jgi:hypothetical protein
MKYIDKEGDDEKRKLWPEIQVARKIECVNKLASIKQYCDTKFSEFKIGDMIYWIDEWFGSVGVGHDIHYEGVIISLDRDNMMAKINISNENVDIPIMMISKYGPSYA